jgi:hypothetical protein
MLSKTMVAVSCHKPTLAHKSSEDVQVHQRPITTLMLSKTMVAVNGRRSYHDALTPQQSTTIPTPHKITEAVYSHKPTQGQQPTQILAPLLPIQGQ